MSLIDFVANFDDSTSDGAKAEFSNNFGVAEASKTFDVTSIGNF